MIDADGNAIAIWSAGTSDDGFKLASSRYTASQGVASGEWHRGLHGGGDYGLGIWGRLWYGSPLWAKVGAGATPVAAGAVTYTLED